MSLYEYYFNVSCILIPSFIFPHTPNIKICESQHGTFVRSEGKEQTNHA